MGRIAVTIVPVDLGEDVSDIISREVFEITELNRDKLDVIRQTAALTVATRDRKVAQRQQSDDTIRACLDAVLEALLNAGPRGVPAADVMSLVSPHISTLPAFTLRMKSHLKRSASQHTIARVRDKYYLTPVV